MCYFNIGYKKDRTPLEFKYFSDYFPTQILLLRSKPVLTATMNAGNVRLLIF